MPQALNLLLHAITGIMEYMNLAAIVKEKAFELGFDAVGITDAMALAPEQAQYLRNWLTTGKAADMGYMHRNLNKRMDPSQLLPAARSVICVAISYKPPAEEPAPVGAFGIIADYATFQDYHTFMKEKLFTLADILRAEAGGEPEFKVCVDSSPIAERSLAARAGLGFIGTNRMLINATLGPAIFLGELVTDMELAPDATAPGGCGDCTACINACPTGALSKEGLDARKCLSYLTIEHKGEIPHQLAGKMGRRLYGCDECVHACPYHIKAPPCIGHILDLRTGRKYLDLARVLEWDEPTFRNETTGTPVGRPGLTVLKRNAAICIANSRQR
jgi:epoxyqueuosine reductase